MKEDVYVDIEVDLDNETILKLALQAHENDITLNELINIILRGYIEECMDDCEHENIVDTVLWGIVCKDCGEYNIIDSSKILHCKECGTLYGEVCTCENDLEERGIDAL